MFAALAEFVVLALVIVLAGTVLTRCADRIAEITGWGRLLIGSLLLAGATSLPEMTVDISAVRMGLQDLAVGDLMGSSLMNLLILATLDACFRSPEGMLSRSAEAHALSGTLSILLTGAAGLAILTVPLAPDWTFLQAHLGVWLIFAGYLLGVRIVFYDQRVVSKATTQAGHADSAVPHRELYWYGGGFLLAAVVVFFAGPYLAETAGRIAELSGLGNSFVGTTFVALSTSLPELVASITALRMGAMDLVIGNIFGSNAFNMCIFLPLDLADSGALFAAINPAHAVSTFCVIMASSVVIMGQLYRVTHRIRFLEPDPYLVICLILLALILVYVTSQAEVSPLHTFRKNLGGPEMPRRPSSDQRSSGFHPEFFTHGSSPQIQESAPTPYIHAHKSTSAHE